jgi:transposase
MKKELSVIGIDLAKSVFHVVGMDPRGQVVLRKRLSREAVMSFIVQLPPLLIGLEACGSAHYWARRFQEHGHEVKLIAPQFVRPYVKSNKNDTVDAEAICEAVTRPTMRFVPIKTVEQQDWQAVHRVRERLVTARTALVNEVRGLLAEYGIVLPKGITRFRAQVVECCERHTGQLSPLGQELFQRLYEEFVVLDERIGYYDKKITLLCNSHPSCQRLKAIPGFGALAATALVAAVGEASRFQSGRQMAAWVGVVPRQHSTGGKSRLLGISKRGDVYLRKLLIHGARAALRTSGNKTDRTSRWVQQLVTRRGHNRATVALANKHVRVAWALLCTRQPYQAQAA